MTGWASAATPSRDRPSPQLSKGVAGGDLPAAASRGLVLADRVVEGVRDLGEERAHVEAGGPGVYRVPGGDHERVDLAALDVPGERLQRGGGRGGVAQDGTRVAHGGSDVAERGVHGVGQRVHGGRLARAGQHERPAAVGLEVGGHRPGGPGQLGRERRSRRDHAELGGDGAGERGHLGAAHPEAMVGAGAGERQGRLGHVEAAHVRARLPVASELAGEAQ
jgi:hypothetical protein